MSDVHAYADWVHTLSQWGFSYSFVTVANKGDAVATVDLQLESGAGNRLDGLPDERVAEFVGHLNEDTAKRLISGKRLHLPPHSQQRGCVFFLGVAIEEEYQVICTPSE